jgi:hypothetical protein
MAYRSTLIEIREQCTNTRLKNGANCHILMYMAE